MKVRADNVSNMHSSIRAIAPLSALLVACCSSADKPATPNSGRSAPAAPTAAPVNYGTMTVSPEAGSGNRQKFTLKLARHPGAATPAMIGLLVTDRDGSNACYAFRVIETQDTLLVNDSGMGSKSIGDAASIANSQCQVFKGAGVQSSADTISADFDMKFQPSFAGAKTVYAIAQDGAGGGSPLQQVGKFTVR